MALLSLPLFCSHKPNSSLMTVTRNRFSSSSCMAPLIEPMAQHSCEVCGACAESEGVCGRCADKQHTLWTESVGVFEQYHTSETSLMGCFL